MLIRVTCPVLADKVISVNGVPTYEAIAESLAAAGKPPPGCVLKCILSMIKDKKAFAAAAAAGVEYR